MVLSALQIGDYQHVNTVSCNGPAHMGSLKFAFGLSRATHLVEKADELGVSVWVTVAQIDFVVVKVENDFKTEDVLGDLGSRDLFDFAWILEISDLVAASEPTVGGGLGVLDRVN